MNKGLARILIGYFLTCFQFRFGNITVVPLFICYLLILSGVQTLFTSTSKNYFRNAFAFASVLVILHLSGDAYASITGQFPSIYQSAFYLTLDLVLVYLIFDGVVKTMKALKDENAKATANNITFYLMMQCIAIIGYLIVYSLQMPLGITIISILGYMMKINLLMSIYHSFHPKKS